jgi:nitrate/nitrite transporter NarK
MWFNAAIISFLTFGPDFFVLKGYSIGTAGLLTGLLLMGPLTLGPLIGHFIDKFNNNELFIGVGGLGLAVAFWLIAMATVNFILILVIMAVFTALVPTSVFSLTPRISSPENQGLSFGILSAVMNVGVFFGPYVTGLIRDRTASYEGGFITLSIFAVILTITTIILKISIKKTPR